MKSLFFASLAFGLLTAATSPAQNSSPHRILIFGDSNTWGWIPTGNGVPSTRYPTASQWPNVARAALGERYEIVVDALSGRTTDVADPNAKLAGAGLNGSEVLPSTIAANFPLDLVVVMLGTNDLKAYFHRSAFRIALGAGNLASIVLGSGSMFGMGWYSYPAPKVLLIAPPPLGRQSIFAADFEPGVETSKQLAHAFKEIAESAGVSYLDAGSVIQTDGVDGVHFSEPTQRKLGEAVAAKIREILP